MNEFIFWGVFILIISLVIYLLIDLVNREEQWKHQNKLKKQEILQKGQEILQNAELAYRKGLSDLKTRPSNADLKEKVLRLGREYSGYTRKFHGSGGITIYDEVAIMNDINAACANSVSYQSEFNQEIDSSIDQRLKKLSDLKAKNLINEQEFNERREKILNEI